MYLIILILSVVFVLLPSLFFPITVYSKADLFEVKIADLSIL